MFTDLAGGAGGLAAANPYGAALGAVSGLASGGPSSAESGAGNFNFGDFRTGDSIKGDAKTKTEILSSSVIKGVSIAGGVLTLITLFKVLKS
jgi:hypothetical protein